MSRRSTALVLILLFSGCRRPPKESEDFQAAFQLYNQLYAEKLDDSYTDPRMLRVVDLLEKVDPTSMRADEAKELLDKVNKGIADAKARADRLAAAAKVQEAPPQFAGSGAFEPLPAPPNDGGPASGPSLGMTRDEMLAKFGDCFERKGDYEQGDKRGEAFGLIATCGPKFPAFNDSVVVLVGGKVTALVPLKELTVRTVDAGSPPAPSPVPPQPPQPPPVPAHYLPGMPVPSAAPADQPQEQ